MDSKIKHLEFIQGVVNRLSTNSFLLKGWSVVIISALIALMEKGASNSIVLLALIPAIVFWGLDGYFLSLERAYRKHYNRVRTKNPDEIDFCMNASDLKTHLFASIFSKTLMIFHGILIVSIGLIAIIFST